MSYVLTAAAASLLSSLAVGIASSFGSEKTLKLIKFIAALTVGAVLAAPLTGFLADMTAFADGVRAKINELTASEGDFSDKLTDYGAANLEAAVENMLAGKFSLSGGEAEVRLLIETENGSATVKSAHVFLYGGGRLLNTDAVAGYVRELLGCDVYITGK